MDMQSIFLRSIHNELHTVRPAKANEHYVNKFCLSQRVQGKSITEEERRFPAGTYID